jgi:hypothetical protein
MKALSLYNPWGILIPLGAKTYETRSWQTSYRGPVAIHVAKHFGAAERTLFSQSPFKECLAVGGYHQPADLPRGVFVAIADLVDIIPTEKIASQLSDRERAFGDYTPGRYAWQLKLIRPLHPWPGRGQQGLWQLDTRLSLFLRARIKDL